MGKLVKNTDTILAQAADWHASLSGDDPDFDGFTRWLEADDAHRLAYDQICLADDAISRHAPALAAAMPANDGADDGEAALPQLRRRWPLVTGAMAAAIALAVAVPLLTSTGPVVESTAQGQMRTIALGDTTRVTLDSASSISVNSDNDRSVSLDRGRALFTVAHDAAHPFVVQAGDYQIHDLGTRFEVSRSAAQLVISVAEGEVAVDGHGMQRVTALPGHRITIASNGTVSLSRIDPALIASWHQGQLVYSDAALSVVVNDINRYAGTPVSLDPALANRHFSGVLIIGDGSQLARNLAEVLDVSLTDTPDGQRLGAGNAD